MPGPDEAEPKALHGENKQCAVNVTLHIVLWPSLFFAARLIQTVCNCRTLNLLNPIKPDANLIR